MDRLILEFNIDTKNALQNFPGYLEIPVEEIASPLRGSQ